MTPNDFSCYPLPVLPLHLESYCWSWLATQPWVSSHIFLVPPLVSSIIVFRMSIVTCPGCNRAFTAGRNMCVHLYHSPQCHAKNVPSSANHPFWLVPNAIPFTLAPINHSSDNDGFFHSDDNFPDADVEDEDMWHEEPPLHGDDCLLDVVVFPRAHTTSQKYEAQLL